MCCEAPVLTHYYVRTKVTMQCDAGKNAVGAVVLQEGRLIACASWKLRDSELNWAPILNEMLRAIVFTTHKYSEYILGKITVVQTNHKPLETILSEPMHGSSTIKIVSSDPEIEWLEYPQARNKCWLAS